MNDVIKLLCKNIPEIEQKCLKEDNIEELIELATLYIYMSKINSKFRSKSEQLTIQICNNKKVLDLTNTFWYIRLGYLIKNSICNDEIRIYLYKTINIIILKRAEYKIKKLENYKKLEIEDYDIFSGICGIGRYLLDVEYKDSRIEQMVEKILVTLIKYAEPYYSNNILINKFYIENENINNKEKKDLFTSGYLDLGLAHGIASPLFLLGICYEKNIVVKNQKKAISNLLDIYIENNRSCGNKKFWPKYINKDNLHMKEESKNRPSWCYGSLGILTAIDVSSRAIGDIRGIKIASSIIENLIYNDIKFTEFISPTFCHGYSGLYHIISLYFKRNNLNEVSYLEKIEKEIEKFIEKSNIYIFEDINIYKNIITKKSSMSMINGCVSVFIPIIIEMYDNIEDDFFSKLLFLK